MGRKQWEKGEIACYEQFLLFPQCFQKACLPGASKGVIGWEWVKKSTCVIALNKEQFDTTSSSPKNVHLDKILVSVKVLGGGVLSHS